VKTLIAVLIGAIAAGGVFAYAVERDGSRPTRERDIAERPIQDPVGGFASSDGCRACHPSQFASWRASYHRTMTQVATPDSVVASFDDAQVTEVPGHPMRLERRGRALWAELDDPDWNGEGAAPPRISRQVVMTTGSHHQQIFWYATGHGRLLGQLPAIRLVADDRWIPRRSAVMHPPNVPLISESGSWNAVCVSCHTTQGKTALSTPWGAEPLFSQQIDTTAVEFGIACESCHGPAADHIRANRSPARRYALHLTSHVDSSIVQPLRLDPRRSSEVCGQCHGLWEFYDAEGERAANRNGLSYRPGDVLTNSRFIVQPSINAGSPMMKKLLEDDGNFVRDIFWSDGMVRSTGREYNGLIDSPCYRNAKDDQHTLTCFSCHSLHRVSGDSRSDAEWADDQLKPDAQGNGACTQCHSAIGERLAAHTHHASGSSGSSCYNCHMPHTTYGLLKTIRSHQISSPSVQASLDTGRPNACNLCHLDKTHQWTAAYLKQWYNTTPPTSMSDDDRTVAASLVSLLKGDAGQRAIIAQAFGWPPAQKASGTAWMAPYVALLLNDSYDAVRYIAARSLKTLPGYETFAFDFVAPETERAVNQRRALGLWRDMRARQGRPAEPTLLFNADGTFIADRIDRLSKQRNNRRVFYRE
jgi:formate-dependent nitrite reductase cytochrome c552 subunit